MSLLEHRGLDPFQHHHSDSVVQPKAKRPRKTKAGSNATVEEHADADPVDNAQAPANEEDDAGWVHQEDPAGDAHEEDGRGGEEEFHHGLTMDEGETHYWSFPEQLWFPLTMNDSGDFYWNYPEQTWSRFK